MKFSDNNIGRYHLIEPLGEGGMAVVYKAYDTHLECEVALKVIRVDNLPRNAEERALKRFEREAKAVARLTHPNIVKVTDYGEEDGKPYLVMPYLPGGTLKQLIKEHGQIPWQEAARILIPIAEALAYAHEEKVIHRDIKPSNILLTRSGQPMLTDFGVAKIIEDEATQDLTGTSATVGTPEYMAPEQITSKTVDTRADLYSLGVVFYEMITGRKPFEADTPMAVMIMHSRDPLPRPSQFVKNLPENVEHLLIKALTKKPEDRYQTANEMVHALRELTGTSNKVGQEKSSPAKGDQEKNQVDNNKQKPILKQALIIGGVLVLISIGIVIGTILTKSKTTKIPEPTINNPTPTITATMEVTNTSQPTSTPTTTVEPTTSSTSTPAPIQLTISQGSSVNCRYVADEIGKVIGVFGSESVLVVNGTDSTKKWINVAIEPVFSETNKQTDVCWIFKSDKVSISNEENLPVVESEPVYTIWNLTYKYSFTGENLVYLRTCTNLLSDQKQIEIAEYNKGSNGQIPNKKYFDLQVIGPYRIDLWNEYSLNSCYWTLYSK